MAVAGGGRGREAGWDTLNREVEIIMFLFQAPLRLTGLVTLLIQSTYCTLKKIARFQV